MGLLCRKGSEWMLVDFKIDELRDLPALQTTVEICRGQVERYTHAASSLLGVQVSPRLAFLDCMGEMHVEPVGAR